MNASEEHREDHAQEPASADVGAQRIAHVYAEALLNAAEQQRQDGAVQEELESLVADVFGADAQFEVFLSSAVARERKAQVIRSVFQGRATDLFVNFLQVLNDHDRLNLVRPVLADYRELRNERGGRMRVLVKSAAPLDDGQRERLRQELVKSFQREPIFQTQVDPDLLGGLVVRVGDWVYDASVRTQLETLRNQLITSGSHEIQNRRDRFSH